MPDAPTDPINSEGPQVQPSAGFTPNVSPAAFGAGIGSALEGLGNEVQRFAMYEKRYHDSENATDAVTKIQLRDEQDHADLAKMNFQSPVDLHAEMYERAAKRQQALSAAHDSLQNEHQRAIFERGTRGADVMYQRRMDAFELGTRTKIETTGLANFGKVQDLAAANNAGLPAPPPDDPNATPAADYPSYALAQKNARIDEVGQHLNWSPDQIAATKAQAASSLHTSVLDAMVGQGKDAQQARDYFKAHETEIAPQERQRFDRVTDEAVVGQKSGAIAGEIINDPKTKLPGTSADILERMDARMGEFTDDPRMAAAVQRHVNQFVESQDRVTKLRQNSAFSQAYQIQQQQGYDAIPKQLISHLTPEDDQRLQGFKQPGQPNEKEIANTSAHTRYGFEQILENPATAAALTPVDIDRAVTDHTLSIPDAEKLRKDLKERDATAASGTVGPRAAQTAMVNQSVDKILAHAGINPSPSFEKDAKNYSYVGDFRSTISAEVQRRVALGQKVGPDDVDKIAAQYRTNVSETTPGSIYGTNTAQVPLFDHIQHLEAALPPGKGDELREAYKATWGAYPSPPEYADMLARHQAQAAAAALPPPPTGHWDSRHGRYVPAPQPPKPPVDTTQGGRYQMIRGHRVDTLAPPPARKINGRGTVQ